MSMRMSMGTTMGTSLALGSIILCAQALGAELGGGARALEEKLAQRAGVTWAEQPLRAVLERVRSEWQVPVFLDRRIDPDQRIALELTDSSLSDIISALAEVAGAEACALDTLVYIGPSGQAEIVVALAELRLQQAAELSPPMAQTLRRRDELLWPDLTEPRSLVEQLATQAGLRVASAELLVHDLWAAQHWPPLPLSHRLTLLLAGFDLTWRIDESQHLLVIEPIPANLTFERTYPAPSDAAARLRTLEAELPDAQFVRRGRRVTVTGSAAAHKRVREALQPPRTAARATRPPPGAEVRYTLRVRGPFAQLARGLGQRLQLNVTLDPVTRPQWETPIDVEVKDVTLAQLLDALVEPVGLRYELEGQELRIDGAKP